MRIPLLIGTAVAGLALTAPAYAATITGTAGNDDLTGTSSADTIRALAGDDVVHAYGGHDVLRGGTGSDLLFGGAAGDKIHGGGGSDQSHGQYGADLIVDDRGIRVDLLYGGPGPDHIFANHYDQVYAGPGDDEISAIYPGAARTAPTRTPPLRMTIHCGTGYDRVTFNQPHPGVKLYGCEKVRIVSAG